MTLKRIGKIVGRDLESGDRHGKGQYEKAGEVFRSFLVRGPGEELLDVDPRQSEITPRVLPLGFRASETQSLGNVRFHAGQGLELSCVEVKTGDAGIALKL